jgi:hypothetical protein
MGNNLFKLYKISIIRTTYILSMFSVLYNLINIKKLSQPIIIIVTNAVTIFEQFTC